MLITLNSLPMGGYQEIPIHDPRVDDILKDMNVYRQMVRAYRGELVSDLGLNKLGFEYSNDESSVLGFDNYNNSPTRYRGVGIKFYESAPGNWFLQPSIGFVNTISPKDTYTCFRFVMDAFLYIEGNWQVENVGKGYIKATLLVDGTRTMIYGNYSGEVRVAPTVTRVSENTFYNYNKGRKIFNKEKGVKINIKCTGVWLPYSAYGGTGLEIERSVSSDLNVRLVKEGESLLDSF